MEKLSKLEPTLIWKYFEQITQVPRPSAHEEKIIAYLENFAKQHSLSCRKDGAGNVVIAKPATPGKEACPGVALQSHIDMVCEKNSDVDFDFMNQGINLSLDNAGWVMAQGTTLGADCGIGMAAALAILASDDITHPAIEALFTVEEETGLTGAMTLASDMLSSKCLINLDSEDEGEIFVGCAGGINTIASLYFDYEPSKDGYSYFTINISGLKGGHSGDDINKGRANSLKCLSYVLSPALEYGLSIAEIDGGNLHNAIPREASAIFGVPSDKEQEFLVSASKIIEGLKKDFIYTDDQMEITINSCAAPTQLLPDRVVEDLISAIITVQNGILSMSPTMKDLVETSSNLASVKIIDDDKVEVCLSQRSSSKSARDLAALSINKCFSSVDFDVLHSDGYPGWSPNPKSTLVAKTKQCYENLFGVSPRLRAIHAGLECGLFLEKFPDLDMVSFGPTIRDVHSPGEKLEIASVDKFWKLLIEILK